MQRRLSRKLSDAVRTQDDEQYRRRQASNPPFQQQIRPGSSGTRHQPEEEFNQQEIVNPYIPQRNINQGGSSRLGATLTRNDFPRFEQSPKFLDRNLMSPHSVWEEDNSSSMRDVSRSSSLDDLSDDISLDDPEVEQDIGLNFFNEPSYDDDYNVIVSSTTNPPTRVKSRSHPVKPKSNILSKTFLPSKKLSKSKSITFEDSDIYSQSGSSSGRTSGTYSSMSFDGRSSSNPSRKMSSQSSISNKHQKDSKNNNNRKHSSTKVPHSAHLRNGKASNSSSHEVMALPIEIPDSVTDEDAFRRYLTRSDSSIESVGLSNSTIPRSQNLNYLGQIIHRRTMALSQAIMTLALLSASASQLRFVVAYSNAQTYPVLNYFLICTCIIVEIFVGIGYVVLSRFEFTDSFAEKVHSYLIFGLFLVAVANVVIASFALDDHVCEANTKSQEQYDGLEQPPPQIHR